MKPGWIFACAFALSCFVPSTVTRADTQLGVASDAQGYLARIVRESPQVTIFDDVDVRLEGSLVVLTGRVTAESKRAAIAQRVVGLQGVGELRNEIVVLPPGREDDDLRHRVAKAIYGNPSFWTYAAMARPPIHILVEHGHVTLKGSVGTQVERTMAGSLAVGLGERSLVNELRTEGR